MEPPGDSIRFRLPQVLAGYWHRRLQLLQNSINAFPICQVVEVRRLPGQVSELRNGQQPADSRRRFPAVDKAGVFDFKLVVINPNNYLNIGISLPDSFGNRLQVSAVERQKNRFVRRLVDRDPRCQTFSDVSPARQLADLKEMALFHSPLQEALRPPVVNELQPIEVPFKIIHRDH